ncbi:PQQ-dependent sugar dehydrogenase [Flavivirga amylovorans]|uniref:PQQ-dependent sugar dehydrogenase n=1 Tax=Flavivirga amylovorans TaxID=870486 RepID=A0ABT8X104_9FLAO|nr:PQQ-dependent sugar dehydrogenase [Flavivirga amylovorans]MDO5987279.1 PQQ-dependent sugar dehydrogenase [Flavivirga amylovorans]
MKLYFYTFFLSFISFANAQITYESAFPNIGFEFPVEIQSPKDGTDRMFVVEQRGRIKVFPRNADVVSADVDTFLNITNIVRFRNGQEVGLLGLAFHPNYTTNGYFYVYYTADSSITGIDVKIVLSRFSVSAGDANLADPNSELILFESDKNQDNSNHNGGKIAFGPDNYLYISFGDGGGGNDPQGNGQNVNTVFGSICRIDVDVDGSNPIETNTALPNGNYEIPSDNPLVNADGLDEIYAYGIRNTWKFAFDNTTGTLWGADVGQGAYEEINIIENGKNYGWSRFEAESVANSGVTISETTEFPVFFYDRLQGDRSITGGYVYRGSEITSLNPDINSKYIFGDYISGRVWALDYNPTTNSSSSTFLFKTNGEFVSSFGTDKNGELYFSDYGNNVKLYKLVDGTTTSSASTVNGIGTWQNLDQGIINGVVQTIATSSNGDVYHGGIFNQAGTINANNIALWNKNSGWQTLGSGSNGAINALKIAPNGNLYAGGAFSEIGGVSANNIAVWNGSSWAALGTGVDGTVAALETDAMGNLYVGGVFETANNMTVKNIALWNGNSWSPLTDNATTISGTNNEIRSLAFDNTVLYVGGNFDEAGGITANRIATWDGSNWGTLGSGTSGFVEAIATTDTDIYIGGNFAIAGGNNVNRIAKWNKASTNWSALGNGVNNIVNSLIHDGTNLYAAGAFNIANVDASNSIIVNNISQWSETNGWKTLGTNEDVGVDIKINTIKFAQDTDGIDKIFVGGNFSNAGSISVNNTAQWLSGNLLNVSNYSDTINFYLYPNPTTGLVNLNTECEWALFNTIGKIIKTGKNKEFSVALYPSGIYFLKIKHGSTLKIIKK